jgi:hypothetical protein
MVAILAPLMRCGSEDDECGCDVQRTADAANYFATSVITSMAAVVSAKMERQGLFDLRREDFGDIQFPVVHGLIKPFVEMVETFGICILDEEAFYSPARYVAKMTPGHDHHFGISAAEVCFQKYSTCCGLYVKRFSVMHYHMTPVLLADHSFVFAVE